MANILLIEDDPLMAGVYKDILIFGKHAVVVANDGGQGIERLRVEKPDLVLLDIMMPKLSGLDLLKRIKADIAMKDVPVVMLTNLADDKVFTECMKNGAAGYIIKSSSNPRQLLSELDSYLTKNTPQ